MAHPACDCHEIHARHNSHTDEMMPAIVKGEMRHLRSLTHEHERALQRPVANVFVAALWGRKQKLRNTAHSLLHTAEVRLQLRVEINNPGLAVFHVTGRADREL